jgi:hypothetical protein
MPSVRCLSSRSRALRTAIAMAACLFVSVVHGQAPLQPPLQLVSPFDMVGLIQKATLDDPSDPFSGGSVTINGHVVVVPRFTILQMPAFALTWHELFALAPLPYGLRGNGQSGLALTDSPPPLASYELHVQGNRVGDEYLAGLVFVSQQALNTGQGFINYIDYARGELRVGGALNDPNTGARVRINDPLAKFSRGDSPDPRFTIDEDNPTVRAETGYPMCLPRVDPAAAVDAACPQGNRPVDVTGKFLSIFTFPPAPSVAGQLPDPRVPAPFEIGDYITFAGTLVADPVLGEGPSTGPYPFSAPSSSSPSAQNGTYVSAYSVIANLGFFTAPNTKPVYVAIDVMLMGTGGLNTANLPQEATLRTRVEGFTTDPLGAGPGTTVSIYAVDVDPCTGATTDRLWVSGVAADIGPPTGAVKGRWRFRPTGGLFLPPPRNLRVTMGDARGSSPRMTTQFVKGLGLETGQYTAPIFEFIFPENLGVGNPPVPANFVDFPFLANGSGPYYGAIPTSPPTSQGVVKTLAPWPGSVAPSGVTCGSGGTGGQLQLPVASAVASPTAVVSGQPVTLDASASVDPNTPASLTFAWTESGTPSGTTPVTLAPTGNPAVVAFVAPTVTTQTTLTFSVAVTNAAGTSNATVSVTVNPVQRIDTVTITNVTYRFAKARLDVTATTTAPIVINPQTGLVTSPTLTLSFVDPATGKTVTSSAFFMTGGAPSITVVGYNAPASVTVTSSFGGSATSFITRFR